MKLSIRVNCIEDRASETTLTMDCYTETRDRVTVFAPLSLCTTTVDDVDADTGEPISRDVPVFVRAGTYEVSVEHFVKGDNKYDKDDVMLLNADGTPDLCKGDGYRVMGVKPMPKAEFKELFEMFR